MKSFRDIMSEASENLPGKSTHVLNTDVKHPGHGMIKKDTALRHTGGNQYEVRAGVARGKIIGLDNKHVTKIDNEETELDEAISTTPPAKVGFNDIVVRKHSSGNHEVVRRGGAYMHLKKGELLSKSDMKDMSSNRAKFHLEEGFEKGDFVKDPSGTIHRVFGMQGDMLSTAPYRGKNAYGGNTMIHKTKATKVDKPTDVTEEVEQIDELSKQTLRSYWSKSEKSMNKRGPNQLKTIAKRIAGRASATERFKGERPMSEEVETINEMTQGKSYTQKQLTDKIKSGNWEAVTDIKPGKHVEMRHHSGKKVMVHVKEERPMSEEVEAIVSESAGDVVIVHQHKHGVDLGKYGKFNIEHETPTTKVVHDHNTGEKLKFNSATGRGIGSASHLMIKNLNKEETNMDIMSMYVDAINKDVSYTNLHEKTLTPAEMKKREEVAKAIERENPDMPMDKKMAIATATAKKVAEGLDEASWVNGRDTSNDPTWKMTSLSHEDAIQKHGKDNVRKVQSRNRSGDLTGGHHVEVLTKKVAEGKEHTVPKTEKEKKLAAIAEPKDKITHKDILVGRGAVEEEADKPGTAGMNRYWGNRNPAHANKSFKEMSQLHRDYAKSMRAKGQPGLAAQSDAQADNYDRLHAKSMKEEVEQIDELSKSTLGSYAKKASSDAASSASSHTAYGSAAQRADLDGDKKNAADWKKSADQFANRAQKRRAGVDKAVDRLTKEDADLDEAMISYSDFMDKIAMHKKAGNKVSDDKYTDKKASYTVVDQEGVGKKITHTPAGSKQEHLGSMKSDAEDDSQETNNQPKKLGRPSGSKSGARH